MYERIIRFGFMSDSLQKNSSAEFAYFSGAIRYFHLFIEPRRDPQRLLSTGQLFLLHISLCALSLGRCFLPWLLQIVQQLFREVAVCTLADYILPTATNPCRGSLCFPG